MAIGKQIRYFRKLRGLKLKELGMQMGFPEKSADVRIAQYEAETRTPEAELTAALAHAMDVSPLTLTVPDIDSDLGPMHTLFTMENTCGLRGERWTARSACGWGFPGRAGRQPPGDAPRLAGAGGQTGGGRDHPGGIRQVALPLSRI